MDFYEECIVDILGGKQDAGVEKGEKNGEGKEKKAAIKVTGMPGKHVPPGVLGTLNEIVEAVSIFSLLAVEGWIGGFRKGGGWGFREWGL